MEVKGNGDPCPDPPPVLTAGYRHLASIISAETKSAEQRAAASEGAGLVSAPPCSPPSPSVQTPVIKFQNQKVRTVKSIIDGET